MGEKVSAKRLKEDEQKTTKRPKRITRKAERLKEENEIIITILSEITNPPKEKIHYNYSADISMYGAKIKGNVLLPVDTNLKIELKLRNSKQKVIVFGKVIWSKFVIGRRYYEAGVEFINTPSESIKMLGDYILSINQYKNLASVGLPYWIFAKFKEPESE